MRILRKLRLGALLRGFSLFLEDVNPLYPIIFLACLITIFFLKSSIEEEMGKLKSRQDWSTATDSIFHVGCIDTQEYLIDPVYQKQNATFIMLARNNELTDVLSTLENIESHFNQWFHYPYVFLNDEPFTEEFKREVQNLVSSESSFGILNEEQWTLTDSVELNENIQLQGDRDILYGDNPSYHKMCRFYSGWFYRHELVQQYEWYWRLEPAVEFYCDLTYDPFYEMSKSGKKYGFTVIIPELADTIPTLFRSTLSYIKENQINVGSLWKLFTLDYHLVSNLTTILDKLINYPHEIINQIEDDIAIEYLLDTGLNDNETTMLGLQKLLSRSNTKVPLEINKFSDLRYNLCHFWSNFEIAKIDVFDNEIYQNYFNYLDASGGFWQERWGDAPVHSLGLSLTLNISDIHYFRDIGYKHSTLQHCPNNVYNGELSYFATDERWQRQGKQNHYDKGIKTGSGCRCKCPDSAELEDNQSYCQDIWIDLIKDNNPNKLREPIFEYNELKSALKKDFNKKN
ncbi:similar to Saccharomyces cerevisiae YIL085C KTR7 Putative mannosyltransferase involved in protein glycosylation [Maudiozyma saulgeensis]|uniref:Similar to Saccharomyces cerevisiae YIL085C KTR7 Putative mannosyltransferase involved in protein glycosylation n=1 Tax=Maudiozyma saulgeensis TaxID=1789683 RepID=A0A1X7R9R8_9SACH|nr:similar to Saccharomyces cerevisiae YIL085C KTR7 Putative mannosyltransferase involved in protein glycosylation [Kazachstania saulgeensis]